MSTGIASPSVGGTLAGGIQDVSAILPLIGTEQCEKHVGSALAGGYLYAAAAPLSIFGSLGIVKAGITILISSISISIPQISISFRDFRPSIKYLGKKKWLGGKLLNDAGFELAGTVAPLIGMDGSRFKAETRLIQILKEKHIDDPKKISIGWKSQQWNIMLFLSTLLAAALSAAPYVALLLGTVSWHPQNFRLPWLYPILRIVGSCGATVTSQLIIQSRVIYLMKNRIIFMIMQQRFNTESKNHLDAWLKDAKFQWDPNLPAEQCISSLEQYALSSDPLILPTENSEGKGVTNGQMGSPPTLDRDSQDAAHHSIKMTPAHSPLGDLHQLQQDHFSQSTQDTAFTLLCWIILGFSLPATVAGYIGCFTLVGATSGNGPLVWLGLEAVLSIVRVFIWASNPDFDEKTEVTVELKLSEHQPMVTTNSYNHGMVDPYYYADEPFAIVPEDEFLARITPFTGPLDRFHLANNIRLYFTLTTSYNIKNYHAWSVEPETMSLFMTVFDFNTQLGVTVVSSGSGTSFFYYDVGVKYNVVSRSWEAGVQSKERLSTRPWRMEDDNLFYSLEMYYRNIVGAFHQRDTNTLRAILPWKWDLASDTGLKNRSINKGDLSLPLPEPLNQLYLDLGYNCRVKSILMESLGLSIPIDIFHLQWDARRSCMNVLNNVSSEKEMWAMTECDVQSLWGWAKRELAIIKLSVELEDLLHSRMNACISEITRAQGDERLRVWMSVGSDSGRRKRLEDEREAAKERMKKAEEAGSQRANSEGRPWIERDEPFFIPHWDRAIDFIDKLWLAGIKGRSEVLRTAEENLNKLIAGDEQVRRAENEDRFVFVNHLKKQGYVSHERWLLHEQRPSNAEAMNAIIETIRCPPAYSPRGAIARALDGVIRDHRKQQKSCQDSYYNIVTIDIVGFRPRSAR